MTKNTKQFLIFGTLIAVGAVLFAQSAETDFTTTVNADGSVTVTRYEGWDSKVTIPATISGKAVTSIGESAFARQENLVGVTIPDSVTSIGESAFANNKLTSVTFGKGIVSIGEKAFYNNNLTSVVLPDTIKYIGVRAFSHNLLAKITIPGFNTYIDELAFARNKQLTSVTLGSLFTFNNSSTYGYRFTSFIEEEDDGERGKNLFFDYVCNDRKAGTYTPDLKYRAPKKDGDFDYVETRYGAALIEYNGTSTSIQLPEKAGGLAVKYIDTSTFEYKDVDRVRIPNSVTSIGNNAFYGKGLTSVAIPDSVMYIGYNAFAEGYKLSSVTLGKGLVIIRPSAFYNQNLTSVIIPDSVTYIGDSAFESNKLTSVVIPDSVISIGDRAIPCYNVYESNGKKAGVYKQEGNTWIYAGR